jgi:hypothetical protein
VDVGGPERSLPAYPVDDDLLAVERVQLVQPTLDIARSEPNSFARFAPRVARAAAVRSSDSWKRLIESSVGTTGSLDRVKASLGALASRQSADGSWPDAAGQPPGATTALVLLSFLGDGHSSRGGSHRDAVQRGVAWLRERGDHAGGAYGLWVLAEDYLLVNGALTPAENQDRSAEITARAAALVKDRDATAPAEVLRSALDAAAQAGLAARRDAWAVVATVPADATSTEAWAGSAILRAGHGEEFRAWARTASLRLKDRLGPDGLAKGGGGATESDRILETAMLLLALQTPYRTL